MESPGTRLKKIRLEKGFTLEEVHKKTKIHLNILKSLEEDSLASLNPVYTKGFLKIYCKFLGVDPREYISDYKEPVYKAATVPLKEEAAASFSLLDFWGKLVSNLLGIKIKPIIITAVALVLLAGIFKIGKGWATKRHAQALTTNQNLIVVKAQNKKTTKEITSGVSPRIGIHARENCYLTIKSDGRVNFQGTLKKGMSDNWQAKDKIEFSLNNAGAVELQINGKSIPAIGRKGQAVKGIISKDGGLEILR